MSKNRIWFFVIALTIGALGLYLIWGPYGLLDFSKSGDKSNVAVEFHGMIFDIILFGVILTAYELYAGKKQKIERYREEIDDFKGWDEKEATFRIVGNIKRLNRAKATKIDLRNCYLKEAKLYGANLREADLKNANLSHALLNGADLSDADLRGIDLSYAHLFDALLTNANITSSPRNNANLSGASLDRADLREAYLRGANLGSIYLIGANLTGANLTGANLNGANLNGVKGMKKSSDE
jgi:uncharacterized protein YjbI with pentapeptide repeats